MRKNLWAWLLMSLLLMAPPALAQEPTPMPFGLPFDGPPGPSTWALGQMYGNTTGAFRQRYTTYRNGQGVHFGIDFSAPCGTPVLAIGDGVVSEVDGPHGAAPHNLVIDHPNGYSSLYGHLLERPALSPGQAVRKGQVVALSGDSFATCHSAPHLHLEIRDHSHTRLFNPVLFIEADWDTLSLFGTGPRTFQRDLEAPRRWQTLTDQPEVTIGGGLLNDFGQTWPPDRRWP